MADVIVNHVSSRSPQFRDFSEKGSASTYAGMFLTFDSVFPDGASETDLLAIYRPRPGLPFTPVTFADGTKRLLWTTFTPEQIDIDVTHARGVDYLESILAVLAENGVGMVRLDAVGACDKAHDEGGMRLRQHRGQRNVRHERHVGGLVAALRQIDAGRRLRRARDP